MVDGRWEIADGRWELGELSDTQERGFVPAFFCGDAGLGHGVFAFRGSVLISERGIYAASSFKAIGALKRAKARAPKQIGTLLFSPSAFRFPRLSFWLE